MASQDLLHRSGRTAAFVYLLIGLALLLIVFWRSYEMLTHPIPGMTLPHVSAGSAATQLDFGRMGAAVIAFVLRLLALLVMTVVASLIAARGVHLYHVASAPTGSEAASSDESGTSLSLSTPDSTDSPATTSTAARRQ